MNKNLLHKERSAYLLQHANNPVDWEIWSEDAFSKAKHEGKLVVVSIGYSSCHWCHVMEKQCFEDEEVAALMNKFFVCIKVDREERPDLDQVYMDAVQIMTGRGGWPLNCILLPDQRPLFGGTYFPKEQWMSTLRQLSNFFKNEPEKCNAYAEELIQGMSKIEKVFVQPFKEASVFHFDTIFNEWSRSFDQQFGGENRLPKFVMPNSLLTLLNYGDCFGEEKFIQHVLNTLLKISAGGIYDVLDGGFARYSTDPIWKIPHFEKMLYDNAQIISCLAHCYQLTNHKEIKRVVDETLAFLNSKMLGENNLYYAAIDADTEGVEGKFYVWSLQELKLVLKENYDVFNKFYCIEEQGLWEHDSYVLQRKFSDEEFASRHHLEIETFRKLIKQSNSDLVNYRNNRPNPFVDTKAVVSWNALTISAIIDVAIAFNDKDKLVIAEQAIDAIERLALQTGLKLSHCIYHDHASEEGFLEDHSFFIESLIKMYNATYKNRYLISAIKLLEHAIIYFGDEQQLFFNYTDSNSEQLIITKTELQDNVIPSSNAVMANNLYLLGRYIGQEEWITRAEKMVANMQIEIQQAPSWYARWLNLAVDMSLKPIEIVIVGEHRYQWLQQCMNLNLLNCLYILAPNIDELPDGKTMPSSTFLTSAMICADKSCLPIIESIEKLNQCLKEITT